MTKGTNSTIKPIYLYDHLPGILAGFPAVLFAILAVLSLPQEFVKKRAVTVDKPVAEHSVAATASSEKAESTGKAKQAKKPGEQYPWWVPNPHMLFWIGLSIMLVWYIAFAFNLPKNKFWLLFGLLGTFVGIPVVLEITTSLMRPFSFFAHLLGSFAPQANAGAFFVLSLVFFVIWLANFVWSRTHMRVYIDETGLTINQLGGKGERFELIGLKTENEPLDYLELFLAGVGSLSLKTRMNKPIFTMNRVIGLYRIPIFPFYKGKLAQIEEILSHQGKVVSVEAQELADSSDQLDAEAEELSSAGGEEGDAGVGEQSPNSGEIV
jgi:hypothetical protein